MADFYPPHGGQLRQIAERFGIDQSRLLDFSANINPSGPPPSVLPALHASLDDLRTLTDYPDLQQAELKQAIARDVGVSPENIIVANGFVPLLEAAVRTLKIASCILPVPAFNEYRRTLERTGTTIFPHILTPASSFLYDPQAILAKQHEAILLANPQNPSGVCHDAKTMRDLVTRAAHTDSYVLLDEAFIDYVPEHSLATDINEHRNLIVFRSVTKFYALPGLRVAYAVAHADLASAISAKLPPWPITSLASRAVVVALGDREYGRRSRDENATRKIELHHALGRLGLHVYPTVANFVLFRLPSEFNADQFWEEMIVTHQIVLRACANYEELPAGHFRAAVRSAEDNHKLLLAIAQSLRR